MARRCIYRTANAFSYLRGLSQTREPLPQACVRVPRLLSTEAQRRYSYPKSEAEEEAIVGDSPEQMANMDDDSTELISDLASAALTEKLKKESSIVAKQVELQGQRRNADPEFMYVGISMTPFAEEICKVLLKPLHTDDVEIKPDGLIYLPEIKYRRILHQAFGPGGWALMPRGEPCHYQSENEAAQLVTREFALFCLGRFVSQSVGEHSFYAKSNLSMGKALESAKSNALMRCCKDLGIASELWDPQYVNDWKARNATDVWCEHVRTKEKKKLWKKRNSKEMFPYPWKEIKA